MEVVQNALYMVAGPIGNLSEVSERALKVLNAVNLVACEDSRVSGKLLSHLGLKKKLVSCNAHNEQNRAFQVIDALRQGEAVAYLSDAGTPGISDPGAILVKEVARAGYPVYPVSGPSALTALLSVAGFNLSKGFFFSGFLPRTPGKLIKLIENQVMGFKATLVAFESPYRIRKSLKLIAEHFPTLEICLGRELTKLHEQILRGNIQVVAEGQWPEKGEFVLALQSPKLKQAKEDESED